VRRRFAPALLLVAGLAVAPAAAPRLFSPARVRLDGCLTPGPEVRILKLEGSRKSRFRAAILGSGKHGVVLSNQSEADLCSWLPFARTLVAEGFAVLVYDYGNGTYRSEVTAASKALRRRGVRRVALIGSSQGAKVAMRAAWWTPARASALVAISPERRLGGHDMAKDARHIRVPTLFVASADDPWGAGHAVRRFYRLSKAKRKRLIVQPGSDHGLELLAGPHSAELTDSILAFLGAGA
jgi:pimeloyl-ACP methyl ester carboxylesterase